MKIVSRITKALKGNTGNILRKGVGVAALGMVGYDAHYIGKLQADLYASERDALGTAHYLNNSMYSNSMSKLTDGVKNTAVSYTHLTLPTILLV